jgi:WD40 repeat protein
MVHEFAIWDVPGRKLTATVKAHDDAVTAILLPSDGKTVVTGSHDGTVKVWSRSPFHMLHSLTGHLGSVQCMALSQDGVTLAVGSGDLFSPANPKKSAGGLRLWSTNTWQKLSDLPLEQIVYCVAFCPKGKRLGLSGTDGMIRVFEINGRRQVATFRGDAESVRAIAFSPDGKLMASGTPDGAIKLWQIPKL